MTDLSLPRGVLTPLVTPFRKGSIDEVQLETLVERQIAAGIHGLVVCDQIGEGLSLSERERERMLTAAVNMAADRIPIIAAAGTNCTSKTIDLIAGVPKEVDAVLIAIPYYSKPTPKGIIRHFQQIAETTTLPIIIDDDPKRTVRGLTLDILRELAASANILGVRHCSGDVAGFIAMPSGLKRRFTHYAGDDQTALAYLMVGATSVSSPIANLLPELVRSFYDLTRTAAIPSENALHGRICRAIEALGQMEPSNLKQALSILTGRSRDVRLPLLPIDEPEARLIAAFMAHYVPNQRLMPHHRSIDVVPKIPMRF